MEIFYFAFLLAFSFSGNQFAAEGDTPTKAGVEVRILEALGPQGKTLAECEAYANAQRKRAAVTYRLSDPRILKYQCTPLSLAVK